MTTVEPPKSGYLVAPILLALFAGLFFWMGGEATRPLWRESGPVENLSALGYLIGAIAALLAALRQRGLARWYLVLWAVFCVLCLGEETSWFQHYIGYHTPDAVATNNAQGEFNIHNLNVFHGGHLTSASNHSFAIFLKVQILFQIGFTIFFLIVPLLVRLGPLKRLFANLGVYVPSLKFVPFVWAPILVSVVFNLLSTGATKDSLAEVREMMYAAAIGCFLVMVYIQTRSLVRKAA
jgi:hypothetical protein